MKRGDKAQSDVKLAEEVFQKWDSRECGREVKGGGLWVVPAYGIDLQTGRWSTGCVFLANHNPDGWGGLSATPWFSSLSRS